MRTAESSFEVVDPSDPNGPIITEAYVCASKGGRFELTEITLPSLTPTMVEAKMIMVGLCHTDIHMRDNDWGTADYPLCAGHEGVATVTRIGSAVRAIVPGDRIAITWIRDSCTACSACMEGRENICETGYQGTYLGAHSGPWGKSKLRYNEHGGCFSRIQRIEERFAVVIPEKVPSEVACPLLCGGGTVYEPLCTYGGPNVKVGIGSVGGLGTAAIKLGKLRGCIIYALSASPRKKKGALAAGADVFVDTTDNKELEACAGTLDVVIDTAPVNQGVAKYLNLLKNNGVLCRVGIPSAADQSLNYDLIPLIFQQKTIAGSIVTGTRRMKDMLELVSRNLDFMKDTEHWKTEHLAMSQVNEAMENLSQRTNKGYRYVLEW